jgi:hypothetical protein
MRSRRDFGASAPLTRVALRASVCASFGRPAPPKGRDTSGAEQTFRGERFAPASGLAFERGYEALCASGCRAGRNLNPKLEAARALNPER